MYVYEVALVPLRASSFYVRLPTNLSTADFWAEIPTGRVHSAPIIYLAYLLY